MARTPFSRLSDCEKNLRERFKFETSVRETVETHFIVHTTGSSKNSYDEDIVHEVAREHNLHSFTENGDVVVSTLPEEELEVQLSKFE